MALKRKSQQQKSEVLETNSLSNDQLGSAVYFQDKQLKADSERGPRTMQCNLCLIGICLVSNKDPNGRVQKYL